MSPRGHPYEVEPIRRLLLAALESGFLYLGEDSGNRTHPSGISYRTIRRIMFEPTRYVGEYLLDRIICGVLDDPSLWWQMVRVPPGSGPRRQKRKQGPHGSTGIPKSEAHRAAIGASVSRAWSEKRSAQGRDVFGRFA